MTHLFTLLAQASAAAPKNLVEQFLASPMILLIVGFAFIYFAMIRPGRNQRMALAARIAALQSGDKVVTTAGIYGIVNAVKEKTVVIKIAEGTMVEFDKAAVSSIQK